MFLRQVMRRVAIKFDEPIPKQGVFLCRNFLNRSLPIFLMLRLGRWVVRLQQLLCLEWKCIKLIEVELFFGVLLVLTVSLLMVLMGLILPLTYGKANDSIG
jgi:hypothetical protein